MVDYLMLNKFFIFRSIIFLLISINLLFAQSATGGIKIKFHDNPDVMEQEILKVIPLGTSITEAKKIMEKNGFICELVENGAFSDIRHDSNTPGRIRQKIYKNIDFLYCDISKGFVVARRWQASLVYEDNQVKQIGVSTGLVES